MRNRAFAIIPAAGMGKRMGASINKQYLMLAGKPIVAHTIELFQNSGLFSGIILVIPEEEIPYCRKEVVEKHALTGVTEIVAGGAERQNSVLNGLKALTGMAAGDDTVVIHDGVRPFIDRQTIEAAIAATGENTGSLVAVPAKDTIKVVHSAVVTETPDRSFLWQAQTPQCFRYADIMAAHGKAEKEGFLGTDDCSLLERYGGIIRIVNGSYRNIKITTPEDLVLAGAFMNSHQ